MLTEMRFHIPPSELAGEDTVEAFKDAVMKKASVVTTSGDAIAIFREIHCLSPRGRYDIKIFPTYLHLHGKTFDYKIAASSVMRLFLLPHKDQRQTYFVVNVDPPIKQGQTRYHYLVFNFKQARIFNRVSVFVFEIEVLSGVHKTSLVPKIEMPLMQRPLMPLRQYKNCDSFQTFRSQN